MSNLRVRFSYNGGTHTGRCNGSVFPPHPNNTCSSIPTTFDVWSAWVVDDVGFPFADANEILEWTDENGTVGLMHC